MPHGLKRLNFIYAILIETVNLSTFIKVNRNKSAYQISYRFGYQVAQIKCNFLIFKNIVWFDNILPPRPLKA